MSPAARRPSTVRRVCSVPLVVTGVMTATVVGAVAPAGAVAPTPARDAGSAPAGFLPVSTMFVSARLGWALGTAPCADRACPVLLRTDDAGVSWSRLSVPSVQVTGLPGRADGAAVSRVWFADPRHGYLVGPALYTTADGGATWARDRFPGQVSQLRTVAGTAVLTTSAAADGTTRVWAAPVGSDQWQVLQTTTDGRLAVGSAAWYVLGARRLFVGHGVAVPTSGAVRCAAPLRPVGVTAAGTRAVEVRCAGDGAAGSTGQQILHSTDGGATFQAVAPAALAPAPATISDGGSGVLLTASSGGATAIFRSTDSGATSVEVLRAHDGAWTDLGFGAPSLAYAVVSGAATYLSCDAGATWAQVTFA